MNTIETTDPSAEPWSGEDLNLSSRPLETEADLIAAAAPPGDGIVRYLIDVFSDDEQEDAHTTNSCSICNYNPGEYVLLEKQPDTEEMVEFGVKWDPTITF